MNELGITEAMKGPKPTDFITNVVSLVKLKHCLDLKGFITNVVVIQQIACLQCLKGEFY